MFKKMFGGGGSPAAPAPRRSQLWAHPAPPPIPEEQEGDDGPFDYAPPPLGAGAAEFERFGSGSTVGATAAPTPTSALSAASSLGGGGRAETVKTADAAEAGGGPPSAAHSFVWSADATRPGWLVSNKNGGVEIDENDDGPVVLRVSSHARALSLSRHSRALSADFERRRSSANFAKLGSDHSGHSSWPTASCHLITAMVGAGILGLPNSFAWLGWIGGPLCLVFFFAVTVFCLLHLIEAYHVGHVRHAKYADAVLHLCGRRHAMILAISQRSNMILTAIGYEIAAGRSLVFLARGACEAQGIAPTAFASSQWKMTLIFGALQVVMSQLPNLEAASWSSAIGAAMSVTYGLIAIALGAMGAHNRLGNLSGRPGASARDRVLNVFSSLGNIAFAFSAAIICIEVQHTLREPPRAAKSMRKSIGAAMITALTLYSLVAVLGYAALGPSVPDDVLIGFEKVNFAPLWLAMLANAAVLLHMIAAVQTYLQPIFEWLEDWLLARAPKLAGKVRPVFLRLALRTPLIVAITAIAVVIPAFGAVTGLVGAATYWPTAVYYPLKTYSNAHVVSKKRALVFRAINCVLLLISLAAMVGAVNGLVETARASFTAFGA